MNSFTYLLVNVIMFGKFTRTKIKMINELSLVSKCYVRYSDRMNKYLKSKVNPINSK